MAKEKEKQLAYTLYMNTDLLQKEIAEKCGVTERTISVWANSEEWEIQKAAANNTRRQQVVNYLMQIKAMNDQIKGREQKYPTAPEADTIVKITRAIEVLQDKVILSDYVMVIEDLTKFLNEIDPAATKLLVSRLDEFIQTKAKQLRR